MFYCLFLLKNYLTNIGIKHGFPCINICKVPREVLKTRSKTPHIQPCPEYSLFSFDWIFMMKVADNLDRHKISDEFEFRQDRTIHFGVTCP